MSDLDARFTAAAEASKTLPERPDNETLLQLYALFKQGSVGDVVGKRPGFTDPVGRAKYDAWAKIKGTESDLAKASYAELVENLAG
jgi:diazepam-binding inhibitor (GABA receptor modulator, acyl-CoA-binding protein)